MATSINMQSSRLSDGSKAWAVYGRQDHDTIAFDVKDEDAARRLVVHLWSDITTDSLEDVVA